MAMVHLTHKSECALPISRILTARMKMDEIRLREKLSHRWEVTIEEQLAHLKQRVAAAQARWAELKKEYQALKKSYGEASRAHLERLRAEIKVARMEFKASIAQWRDYHAFLHAAPALQRI